MKAQNLIHLQSCPKRYTYDQDKACSPEETVARFRSALQRLDLDILEGVRRIDTGRLDIPVYFSVCGREARRVIGNKKQMGKGASPAQAEASACMELAERFSFFSFLENADNFMIGDYAAMEAQGHPVLPLDALLHSVHDTSLSPELLRLFLADLPLQWAWALRLGDQQPVLVPFSWFYAINEFNGPSAGNTPEEALLQGISEVVERHVCALVTQKSIPCPIIDPSSLSDPVALELLDKFHRNGIKLLLSDFSLDTGLPTIGALAWDPATFPERSEIVYTAGTAADPHKALIRAVTEVAQLAGDFNTSANYVASGLPKPRSLDDVAHLLYSTRTVSITALPNRSDADFYVELQKCVAVLQAGGMEVLTLNTTHPSLQIPAAYTIIPGAHFRERAMGGNAGLFAAKLASGLLEGVELDQKLAVMRGQLPDAYYLHFYQGRSLYEQEQTTAALDCFNTALDLQPLEEDRPYLYAYQACCLRDLGAWQEAITAGRQGLACDEDRADLHNIVGVCCFKIGRHDEAVQHFRRAVQLNPTSAIDYANLALNLERLGVCEEAMMHYETALSQDSSIAFAAERLAALLAAVQEGIAIGTTEAIVDKIADQRAGS